jgi:hypothetical protein
METGCDATVEDFAKSGERIPQAEVRIAKHNGEQRLL